MRGVQKCGPLLPMFCGLCAMCLCVCPLNCAKTAEPIEVPKEPCRWGPDPQGKGQFFFGGAPLCDAAFRQNSLTTC